MAMETIKRILYGIDEVRPVIYDGRQAASWMQPAELMVETLTANVADVA